MKQNLLRLCCAAVLLTALTACGTAKAPASSAAEKPASSVASVSDDASSSAKASAPAKASSSVDASSEEAEPEKPVVMQVQYYEEKSGDVLEIPRLTDTGEGAAAINQKLDAIAAEYAPFLEPAAEEYPEWCEVVCYPTETERYINLVLHQNIYPTYGTDGALSAFVFDKETKKELTLDEIMALDGTSQQEIQSIAETWAAAWIKAEETNTPDGGKAKAEFHKVLGARMLPDGTAEYYLSITIGRELATDWTRIYLLRDKTMQHIRENPDALFLIPPDQQIPMEPPLWSARAAG